VSVNLMQQVSWRELSYVMSGMYHALGQRSNIGSGMLHHDMTDKANNSKLVHKHCKALWDTHPDNALRRVPLWFSDKARIQNVHEHFEALWNTQPIKSCWIKGCNMNFRQSNNPMHFNDHFKAFSNSQLDNALQNKVALKYSDKARTQNVHEHF